MYSELYGFVGKVKNKYKQIASSINPKLTMAKSTWSKVATLAWKIMQNPNSSKIQRELAGSALAQFHSWKESSERMEQKAQKVLLSDKYSTETKSLAGSVFSQSN